MPYLDSGSISALVFTFTKWAKLFLLDFDVVAHLRKNDVDAITLVRWNIVDV